MVTCVIGVVIVIAAIIMIPRMQSRDFELIIRIGTYTITNVSASTVVGLAALFGILDLCCVVVLWRPNVVRWYESAEDA